MIRRLIIANRGEIAVRVARAAREMGIAPLGIYSEADAGALHLRFMDDARCVGPAPATESYLNANAVIAAAKALHADALHPGYGFLSESAAFATTVRAESIVFVGPTPEAMSACGSKIEAKRRVRSAGIPVIEGYEGSDQSPERLKAEAERIGFPLLVKASAGGGGRGIRIVASAAEFDEALAAARREARAAFGDDSVFLERRLVRPRHIEFQVLADSGGATVHVGERECSIQRRHQKIVEEAPSVVLTPELRAEMGAAAVRVARSVGYVNAGTVEFLLDESGYYFLELNARLQVEHPVTEIVYGIDLVHWQLRIAAGEPLTLHQDAIAPRGWAIEARVTAEDPAHGMLPSAGRIDLWDEPAGPGIRVDSGAAAGSEVGLYYDSLLAKLIAYASDRTEAIARLERAIDDFRISGIRTNLPLLSWIARDDAFRSGALSTSFLAERLDESIFVPQPPPAAAVLLAIAGMLRHDMVPWRVASVGRPAFLTFDGGGVRVWVTREGGGARLDGDYRGTLAIRHSGEDTEIVFGAERARGRVAVNGSEIAVTMGEKTYRLHRAASLESVDASVASRTGAQDGRVEAPMPGRVLRVAVAAGDRVEPHQLLVVLEAMKMEHRIEASLAATVRSVLVREGAIVGGGAPLVELGNA